jgi:hypothetical protein
MKTLALAVLLATLGLTITGCAGGGTDSRSAAAMRAKRLVAADQLAATSGCVSLGWRLRTAAGRGQSIVEAIGLLAQTPRTVGGTPFWQMRLTQLRTLIGPRLSHSLTGWVQATPYPSPTASDAPGLWAPDGHLVAIVTPRWLARTRLGPLLRTAPLVGSDVILSAASCWADESLPTMKFTGRLREIPGSNAYALAQASGFGAYPLRRLVGFAAAPRTAGARAPATVLHRYSPFGPRGIAPGVRVAKTVSGYCWTWSGTDWRSDAYRCFVGNYIHDPCYADVVVSSKFVLCPISFPGSKVIRIRLTRTLPPPHKVSNPTRHPPWAIRLARGRWCGFFSGATSLIDGLRINYGCKGGGVLLGNPRRHSATWTILYASNFRSTSHSTVKISQAWW